MTSGEIIGWDVGGMEHYLKFMNEEVENLEDAKSFLANIDKIIAFVFKGKAGEKFEAALEVNIYDVEAIISQTKVLIEAMEKTCKRYREAEKSIQKNIKKL